MQLSQALSLIQHSVLQQKSTWADLGCGDGLFTSALSQLLLPQSIIYAVDKNAAALNRVSVKRGIQLEKLVLDFVNDILPFKELSGILMANAFHFVKDKHALIKKTFNCLGSNGYFIFVEYDRNTANPWVPYPVSFKNLQKFFDEYNYNTEKLNEMPSRYNETIYSTLISKKN
jgi:trans-aconitate methyltransferase